MRDRVAPRAARTEISCCRAVARAISSPDTLAVAIRSSNPTAAKSSSVVDRTSATRSSRSGTRNDPRSWFAVG